MRWSSNTRIRVLSLHLLAASYLGACGASDRNEQSSGETSPSIATVANPLEVCQRAGEILGESVAVLLFSTEAADPRIQSLDATPAGTDCSVVRGDGSTAQLFVPDNGEQPFFHDVSP